MRIVFINPPNSYHFRDDLSPPLWATLLGGIARREGAEAIILDLNLAVMAGNCSNDPELYTEIVETIEGLEPNAVCFSSMAVNSHVCILVAKLLKERLPRTLTVFGGPHFSSIATPLLERYSCVDCVAIGQAEVAFRDLVRQKLKLPVNGLLSRASKFQPQPHAFEIPFPDFSLVELGDYFEMNPLRTFDFDGGRRGCVFNCSYCYSPSHFGVPPGEEPFGRTIRDLRAVSDLGAKHLFIVQDNFVNSPRETIKLCAQIAEANVGVTYHCYATLPQLTREVAESLAKSGCLAVYVGVDAVTEPEKARMHKQLFRSEERMLASLGDCLEAGIEPTASFLLPDPDKHRDDFELTVSTAAAARLLGCRVRLNKLALYTGTSLQAKFSGRIVPTQARVLLMDLPPVVRLNPLAELFPDMFPFHSTHCEPSSFIRFCLAVDLLAFQMEVSPEFVRQLSAKRAMWSFLVRCTSALDLETMAGLRDQDRGRIYAEVAFTTAKDVKS